MTIDELVEQQGIDNIQKTTRITKENLKKIISKDFGNLNKAQVFGFLSILEREYGVIDNLRGLCEEYYADEEKIENATPQIQPNRTYSVNTRSNPLDSKLIWLIGGLSALFFIAFMAFDKGDKPDMQIPKMTADLNDTNRTIDLNGTQKKEANATDINATNSDVDKNTTDLNSTNVNLDKNVIVSTLQIVPTKKIWFGMVDLGSKAKKDLIVDKPFVIDTIKSMLIATSKATFSLQDQSGKTEYKDFKSHYFKVDKGVLSEITKEQFVTLGGPKKW